MGSALGKVTEEQPRYEVRGRSTDGSSYEVRAYEPCCVIETSYAAKKMVGGDQGGSFMALARYIGVMSKPENARREKIAMTAPVTRTLDENDMWTVAFVMPSEWTMETLPVPNNPDVTIREVPGEMMATLKFSGVGRERVFEQKRAALENWLAEQGYQAIGAPRYAGYDAPYVPGPFRRNEVMIPVAERVPSS